MKNLILPAILASCFTLTANANDKIVYDYLQFGYIHSAGERTSDKKGINIDISASWTDSVYLHTTYNEQSADVWALGISSDVTSRKYTLSLGWHTPFNRTTDFFAELGYLKQDAENIIPQTTFGNDEDGYFTELGIRGRFSADWEYSIFVGYKDFELSSYADVNNHEDLEDTTYGFEARYYLSKRSSIGLTLSQETTGETSLLSYRYNL